MVWGETNEELAVRVRLWRPWFAWHPITLPDGRKAWLCWVERRLDKTVMDLIPYMPMTAPPQIWEYRLPEGK